MRRSCVINWCYFRWDPIPERLVVGWFIASARCTRPSLLGWFIYALDAFKVTFKCSHTCFFKMSQSLTACMCFVFALCLCHSLICQLVKNVGVSGAKCHFAGLDCIKSNFRYSFERDAHWIDLHNYQLGTHLHTISINIKQRPEGWLQINRNWNILLAVSYRYDTEQSWLKAWSMRPVHMCYRTAHLCNPWASLCFRHWRAWLKC